MILTLIGMLVGLGLGVLLHSFVIDQIVVAVALDIDCRDEPHALECFRRSVEGILQVVDELGRGEGTLDEVGLVIELQRLRDKALGEGVMSLRAELAGIDVAVRHEIVRHLGHLGLRLSLLLFICSSAHKNSSFRNDFSELQPPYRKCYQEKGPKNPTKTDKNRQNLPMP
jgi:hypothetical protein